MSQFQETNPYTQRVASNKAMEEFLVEMDNWDYIDTSALTCELTGVNDSFNLASQDEVTPFQLLRSQVQLEIELGIDNPSSRFALDLISAPTLLSPATPAPIGVLAANSVFFTSSESCSLRDPQVNYGSSQLQLQEIPAPVVPSQGCQSVPWGLPWQPYLNSPLPTPALSQTFSASTAETHLNVPVMNPFSEQHQHSRNFNPQLFERRTTGANRVTEIQQSLSQTQNELTTVSTVSSPFPLPLSPAPTSSSSSSSSSLSTQYRTLRPSGSKSTPTSTTKNTTRAVPYPPRFFIMEPYQHSTAKIDRRSFNSCKELKQAKAKAFESQYQI